MGHVISTYRDPSSMPDVSKGPIFDPMLGFPNGRKKRESLVSEEEMLAAGLLPHQRDYCAPILMMYEKCRRESSFPYLFCMDIRHHYLRCEQADQTIRRKEYERERRLIAKQRAQL
ncbi:unnamed protein product [Calicophoron daubneyi]|uniref:NADH dehydrogenase [ubiquinone] 1 beta subcomplex subunit 7 n=1 Tax=Calicophoron daubneyi TaxID=300641 RepID=A0AAV2TWT1_CALDB